MVVLSPSIARFYDEPELVPLIILLSSNFLIVPLFQINRRLLEKDLQFSTIAAVEIITSIGSGAIGIVMALMGFGVYSLIGQILSLNVLYALSFNVARRWRPSFTFSYNRVHDLTMFSLKIKGARMMGFASRNIDYIPAKQTLHAGTIWDVHCGLQIRVVPGSEIWVHVLGDAFSGVLQEFRMTRIAFVVAY